MALGFITQRNTITSGTVVATLPVLDENFPADVEVAAGASATAMFNVKIAKDGTPANYTYQWYKDGIAVDGANTAVYTLSAGSLNNTGSYGIYCTVTNDAGTVTSRVATLTAKIWKPTLNASFPANVTVTAGTGATATFSVGITTEGNPASYTYQWYLNGSTWPGQTNSTVSLASDWINTAVGSHSIYCIVTNDAGSVQSRTATLTIANWKPTYSYTGTSTFIDDGSYNWRIKFLTSGTLTFTSLGNATTLDIFCVGGGGGGCGGNASSYAGGGGGGGGYTKTSTGLSVALNTAYPVVIGAGGTFGYSTNVAGDGGNSSIFGVSAAGGKRGVTVPYGGSSGGAGGSGGGGGGKWYDNHDGGAGGSNGSDGKASSAGTGGAGKGQGSTTREFGESSGTLYAGGGGGAGATVCAAGGAGGGGNGAKEQTGHVNSTNGTTNLGGGGGGNFASDTGTGYGGSGIVVIRNHR